MYESINVLLTVIDPLLFSFSPYLCSQVYGFAYAQVSAAAANVTGHCIIYIAGRQG